MLHSLLLRAFATIALLVQSILCSHAFAVPEIPSSNKVPRGGPSALERTYSKYGMPVSRSLAKAAAAQLNGQTGSSSADLVDYELMYVTPITIGGQGFNMQFDTGSQDVWVYSTFTPGSMRGLNRHVYDPALSSTSKILVNETFADQYGDGYVSGIAFTDTITVGDLTVPSQAFGLVQNVSSSFYNNSAIDGLVGLSDYSARSGFKPQKQSTFLNTILPLLREPLFTASLNRDSGGFYTFGYVPEIYPESSITWVNSTSDWSTPLTGWSIGNSHNMTSTNLRPIVDTGTPFVLLPPNLCEEYYCSVGAPGEDSYHGESGITYPCNVTLPDLYLQIGGYRARISGEQLSGPEISAGYCFGHLQPIAGPNVPSAVLRDTFLRSTFTVFKIPVGGSPILGFIQKDPC